MRIHISSHFALARSHGPSQDDNLLQELLSHLMGSARTLSDVILNMDAPSMFHLNYNRIPDYFSALFLFVDYIPTEGGLLSDINTLWKTIFFDMLPILVSPVFLRTVFADILRESRNAVADSVREIADVAEVVLEGAEAIEDVVRPEGADRVFVQVSRSEDAPAFSPANARDRMKTLIVDRMAEVSSSYSSHLIPYCLTRIHI